MIKRELGIFSIVGALTVLVDFGAYRSLVWFGMEGVDFAKAIGFLIGTIFSYCANRIWTFGRISPVRGSLLRFSALYFATMGVNVLSNSLALKIFANAHGSVYLAFLGATVISAALNFIGMKLFVFRPCPKSGLT